MNTEHKPNTSVSSRIAIQLGEKLAATVKAMAVETNRRRKYQYPEPTTQNFRGVKVQSKNLGLYSSRCPYIKWSHRPLATSWGVVLNNKRTLAGRIQSTGFRLTAPKGYTFGSDSLGIRMVGPGGTDWHFTASDILDGETGVSLARKIRAKNAALAAQRAAEKLAKSAEAIRNREISTTRVTLSDSRRAGNCVEGTLRWVEQRFGVARQEILEAAHLFSVSASTVLKTGDHRARAAALAAWDRETTISI